MAPSTARAGPQQDQVSGYLKRRSHADLGRTSGAFNQADGDFDDPGVKLDVFHQPPADQLKRGIHAAHPQSKQQFDRLVEDHRLKPPQAVARSIHTIAENGVVLVERQGERRMQGFERKRQVGRHKPDPVHPGGPISQLNGGAEAVSAAFVNHADAGQLFGQAIGDPGGPVGASTLDHENLESGQATSLQENRQCSEPLFEDSLLVGDWEDDGDRWVFHQAPAAGVRALMYSANSWVVENRRNTRAGFPTTTERSGTSLVTTAPAPMIACVPRSAESRVG